MVWTFITQLTVFLHFAGPPPQVYFQNIFRIFLENSIPGKTHTLLYNGIGQNYGNLILQPFSTIFLKYFHAMEEVQLSIVML